MGSPCYWASIASTSASPSMPGWEVEQTRTESLALGHATAIQFTLFPMIEVDRRLERLPWFERGKIGMQGVFVECL